MFTGIVQGEARVTALCERAGLYSVQLELPDGHAEGLVPGASLSVDGVCLTVTRLLTTRIIELDIIAPTLQLTTLRDLTLGDTVNIERAARHDAEIGGHALSGHVDCTAEVIAVALPENNRALRLALPLSCMRYVFAKGYLGVDGASLTVSAVDRAAGWLEVWLIPETLRRTTLGRRGLGDRLNIEIDRGVQVVVDTVHEALRDCLGAGMPALEQVLSDRLARDLTQHRVLPSGRT